MPAPLKEEGGGLETRFTEIEEFEGLEESGVECVRAGEVDRETGEEFDEVWEEYVELGEISRGLGDAVEALPLGTVSHQEADNIEA